MPALRHVVHKIPLTLKVVSLYVLAFLPLYFFFTLPDQPQEIDTNRYISQLVQDRAELEADQEAVTGSPTRLLVPRLGIDLPIEDGVYNAASDSWTLSREAVHYAVMTTPVNDRAGNTLIYGHNNRNILAPTRDIRPGDKLHIRTAEGQTFVYRYSMDVKVDPSDTGILASNPDVPQLTLLTCDGLWNEKRRLMNFEFVEVR